MAKRSKKKKHKKRVKKSLRKRKLIKKRKKVSRKKLSKETKDIDLIIGGHTHTFMNEPLITCNKVGKKVIINQAGCFGLYLGRIDFIFDSNNNKIFN